MNSTRNTKKNRSERTTDERGERQGKLGDPGGVEGPAKKGLASHFYRVLHLRRRPGKKGGKTTGKTEKETRTCEEGKRGCVNRNEVEPNNSSEAYTGNQVGHRAGRTA